MQEGKAINYIILDVLQNPKSKGRLIESELHLAINCHWFKKTTNTIENPLHVTRLVLVQKTQKLLSGVCNYFRINAPL